MILDDHVVPLPDGPLPLLRARWLDRWAFARWTAQLATGRHPRGGTAAAWLDDALPAGPTRRFGHAFTRVSTYAGGLDRLAAPVAAERLQVGLGGVRYLEGGWQRLVDTLGDAARQAGADVHVQRPVHRLDRDERGVVLDTPSGEVHADRVVLAVPPDRAARLLGPPVPAASPVRVASLQLALDPARLAAGPVRRLAIDLDRPVFVSDFSSVIPCGDDDAHVVHAIRYLDDGDTTEQALADLHTTLTRLWPGWREHLRAERFLPRLPSTAVRPEPGRTRPPEQVAPDLFCIGDGYGPDGLLADAAIASAERVAAWLLAAPARAAG